MENTETIDITIKPKVTFDDHCEPIYHLLFLPEINLLISGSDDSEIFIYDLKKSKKIHEISEFQNAEEITSVIEVSSDSFIASSSDGFIRAYKINEKFEISKFFEMELENAPVASFLLKISEKNILVHVHNSHFLIINLERKKITKKLSLMIHSPYYPRGFSLSKKYENSFFITSGSENKFDHEIDLINYETEKTVKIFNSHNRHCVSCISFIDSENKEILVCCTRDKFCYFYNTETENTKYILRIETNENPLSFFVLRKKYLFIGECYGSFEIFSFDLNQKNFKKLYGNEKVHSKGIYELKLIKSQKNKVKICSCSIDKSIKISSISFKSNEILFEEEEETSDINIGTEVTFDDHFEPVYHLLYLRRSNLLISGSDDSKIFIYDLNRNKKIHEISEFTKEISSLIKFSSDSFIASSSDGFIRAYSINENFVVLKFFEMKLQNAPVDSILLKISEKDILVHVHNSPFLIINLEKQEIMRKLTLMKHSPYYPQGFSLSKKNEKSFFITSGSKKKSDNKIEMVNYETEKTVKIFNSHNRHCNYCISFIDSENIEILVCCTRDKFCYFYNTKNSNFILKTETNENPLSFFVLKKKYLFFGERWGSLEIFSFDLNQKSLNKLCENSQLHSGSIYDLKLFKSQKNEVKICSCSKDKSIKISTISFKSNEILFEERPLEKEEEERILEIERIRNDIEKKEYHARNSLLEKIKNELIEANNELMKSNKFLENKNKKLEKNKIALVEAKSELEKSNELLEDNNSELKKSNELLEEKNFSLGKENNEDVQKILLLEKGNKDLIEEKSLKEDEIKKLENSCKLIEDKLSNKEKENKELGDKITILEAKKLLEEELDLKSIENEEKELARLKISLEKKKFSDFQIYKRLGFSKLNNRGYYGANCVVFLCGLDGSNDVFVIKIVYNYGIEDSNNIDLQLIQNEIVNIPHHYNIAICLCSFIASVDFKKLPQLGLTDNDLGNIKAKTAIFIFKYYPRTLANYIHENNHCLEDFDILFKLKQLISGICHLQKHKISHRDLKPDNIFLENYNNKCLIGDFGCSLKCEKNGFKFKLSYNASSYFNRGGATHYLAPEILTFQVKGSSSFIDYSKNDIFSVGLIGCKMIQKEDVLKTRNSKFIGFKKNLKVDSRILEFLKNLICTDPSKRYDCFKALEECEKLLLLFVGEEEIEGED